jgi:hypothetical protein
MLRNVAPTVEQGGLVYREQSKKYFGRSFGSRREKGLVENVHTDSMNDFEPIKSNESEARQVVKLANHQHLRKNSSRLAQATLAYRKSLREFNVCGNCLKPIRVKLVNQIAGQTEKVKTVRRCNVTVDTRCKLTGKRIKEVRQVVRKNWSVKGFREMYADIEAHYRVYNHPTKKNKCFYQLRSKTRVFNQKCDCGM